MFLATCNGQHPIDPILETFQLSSIMEDRAFEDTAFGVIQLLEMFYL